MPVLQGDTALVSISGELENLLAAKPISLLTGQQVLDVLAPLHPGTTLAADPVLYWWYWDERIEDWVRCCQSTAVVTVPQGASIDPIVVRIEDRAIYGS
jgi:hypothetical protein